MIGRNSLHVGPEVLPTIFPSHALADLDQDLVDALYEQRSLEYQILQYDPQASAPQHLKDAFCAARVRVNKTESRIRNLKYGF